MKNNTFNYQICDHKASLQTSAMKFTHNTDDADDLVQDTLLKAIRYSKLYQEGTNLSAWLNIIMKNTFINGYRKQSRQKSIAETSEDLSSFQLLISASENQANHTFISEDIYKSLAQLPSDNYIPFIKSFKGLKHHEIANELSIPIGTVKTRIHVAKQLLNKYLKMYHQETERSKI